MPDIDADYVLEQHDYAKGLYGGVLAMTAEVEKLFKNEYDIPTDAAGKKYGGSPEIRRPAQARAILEKFMSLLSLRATQTIQVIPFDLSMDEQKACSKIERWMRGYQLQYMLETNANPWRHGPYWYFYRGRMCLETRFDASYIGTDKMPLRTLADDPNNIFSVRGHDGIEWYTKCVYRSARSLKAEVARRSKGRKANRWAGLDLSEVDDNDEVEIIEYWDDEHCAAVLGSGYGADGKGEARALYVREHDYGFVPLAEAHCMETPLADLEWASQSVLYPIMDSLKGMYKLAAKLAAGVDLAYWPKILVQTQSGQTVVLDSGAPMVETYAAPGTKIEIIQPTPNAQVIAQLMAWFKGDVQLGGIPDIAWGAEPSSLQSGFAVSQVLGQVMDKIAPHEQALELGFAWDWSHKLRLIEKLGGIKGANLSVPVERDYAESNGVRNPYAG